MSAVLTTVPQPKTKSGYDLLVELIPNFCRILGTIKLLRRKSTEPYVKEFRAALKALAPEVLDRLAELLSDVPEAHLAVDSLLAFRARERKYGAPLPLLMGELRPRHFGNWAPSHTGEIAREELDVIEQNIMDLFEVVVDTKLR